jgi:hypothetical protein
VERGDPALILRRRRRQRQKRAEKGRKAEQQQQQHQNNTKTFRRDWAIITLLGAATAQSSPSENTTAALVFEL